MNARILLNSLAVGGAALALVAGCTSPAALSPADDASSVGADSSYAADLGGSPVGGGGAPDLLAMAYPPGPYGANVGEVIPSLSWVGYVDDAGTAVATSLPYGSYSMLALHQSGRRYGLLHISEVY